MQDDPTWLTLLRRGADHFRRHAASTARNAKGHGLAGQFYVGGLAVKRLPPVAWATATQVFAQFFGLLVFAVLAPVLGPHAFGLVAMVLVFVGFWDAVPGVAATDALISVRSPEPAHYASITTFGAALGIAVGLAIYALAPSIAHAMGDSALVPVMRTMAPLPFIQALAVAPTADAQHHMRFEALALSTVASQLAGGACGLTLALAGAGVWALVWQHLTARSVAVLVLWTQTPGRFTTTMSRRHLRELAAFAMPNMAARTMSWASGQLPRLILGYELGPTGLGLFTMATRLNEAVTQIAILPKVIVARVDLRRFRTQPALLGAAVRRNMLQISVIAFPICTGGAAIIPRLFDTWFGARWHDAIVPAQIMLLQGIPFTTIYMSASVLLALNRQRWEAAICAVQSIVTVLAVACVANFGVSSAAAALLACGICTVPATIVYMRRAGSIHLADIISPQLPIFARRCPDGLWCLGDWDSRSPCLAQRAGADDAGAGRRRTLCHAPIHIPAADAARGFGRIFCQALRRGGRLIASTTLEAEKAFLKI